MSLRDQLPGLIEKQGGVCGICHEPLPDGPISKAIHVDHIYPVAKGGGDEADNLQAAHASCNIAKSGRVVDVPMGQPTRDPNQPRTLNLSMASGLRLALDASRALTGETASDFVRAAIIERIVRIADTIKPPEPKGPTP